MSPTNPINRWFCNQLMLTVCLVGISIGVPLAFLATWILNLEHTQTATIPFLTACGTIGYRAWMWHRYPEACAKPVMRAWNASFAHLPKMGKFDEDSQP